MLVFTLMIFSYCESMLNILQKKNNFFSSFCKYSKYKEIYMNIFDTKFYKFNDGTAIWLKVGETNLPADKSKEMITEEETRKVLKSSDGFLLKDKENNILGSLIWLPDGTVPEGVEEISEEEAEQYMKKPEDLSVDFNLSSDIEKPIEG